MRATPPSVTRKVKWLTPVKPSPPTCAVIVQSSPRTDTAVTSRLTFLPMNSASLHSSDPGRTLEDPAPVVDHAVRGERVEKAVEIAVVRRVEQDPEHRRVARPHLKYERAGRRPAAAWTHNRRNRQEVTQATPRATPPWKLSIFDISLVACCRAKPPPLTASNRPSPNTQSPRRPTSCEPRKFRPDIEGLRAVAVVVVVLSHLGLSFPGGYIGVDVFFVISGFLITRQLAGEYSKTGRISFVGFYSRRAKRILPAATVVIIGTVLACRAWDSPLTVRSDALDGLFSAFSGINWRLAAQGTNYFSLGTAPSPFQHFWSLSVEEQFYFVWPALIVAVGWLLGRRLGQLRSLITTLLVIIAVSLYLSITTTSSSVSWAYFGSQTRVWELAVGALIAVTIEFWNRLPMVLASLMSWTGLIVIAASCFAFGDSTVYPGSAVIAPVLGSALVIAAGVPGWTGTSELLLKLRPFQFVGNISYSWYLTHWPFLMILPMALDHTLPRADKYYVLGGSFVLAVALYYLVERPIRTRPVLLRQPTLGLSLGGIMVMASVIVALLVAGNTGPGRQWWRQCSPGGGAVGREVIRPAEGNGRHDQVHRGRRGEADRAAGDDAGVGCGGNRSPEDRHLSRAQHG